MTSHRVVRNLRSYIGWKRPSTTVNINTDFPPSRLNEAAMKHYGTSAIALFILIGVALSAEITVKSLDAGNTEADFQHYENFHKVLFRQNMGGDFSQHSDIVSPLEMVESRSRPRQPAVRLRFGRARGSF